MKKVLQILLTVYCIIAEIVGSYVIIMFLLAAFSVGSAKFEIGHGDWKRCFGDCQKVEQIKEGDK